MKITGLEVDDFGIWSDLRIDKLSSGITVFYGPNEAGKTTLMQFVRAVLYGFGGDRSRRYLVPVAGRIQSSRTGGALHVSSGKDDYQVRRMINPSEPESAEGVVQIFAEDGSRAGGHRLQTLLSGIDEAIYNNVFAVGLSEIQHLGTLNDTDAAHELYRLSTGGDRVSLVDVMRQLGEARAGLISADGQSSRLGQLIDLRDHCRGEIGELAAATTKWANLKAEVRRLADDMERQEARRDQMQSKLRIAELAEQVFPKWQALQKLDEEIETLGSPRRVADSTFDELKAIKQQIIENRKRQSELKRRRMTLLKEAKSLAISPVLQRRSSRIQALLDQRPWIQSLSARIDQFNNQLSSAKTDIRGHQAELGLTATSSDKIVPTLDRKSAAVLRGPARQLVRDRAALKQVKNEVKKHRDEENKYKRQMTNQLAGDKIGKQSLVRTVESIGKQVGRLKRRLQLDQLFLDVADQLQPLAERRRGLLERQLVPPHVTTMLGGFFALGSVFLLCGIFIKNLPIDPSRREVLTLVGLAAMGAVAMIRFMTTSSSRVDLEACQRQYNGLRGQLEELESEKATLLEGIPETSGEVRLVLHESKDRLARLEKLVPIDARLQEAKVQADVAQRRSVEIANGMKRSKQRWRSALTELGLSTKLTPGEVRRALSPESSFGNMRRNLADIEHELVGSRSELSIYKDRLIDVFAEAQLKPEADEPLPLLVQLDKAIAEQQSLIAQRDDLGRQARKLQREQGSFAAEIRRLRRRRDGIVSAAGALDEEELRTMQQQYKLSEELAQQRKSLMREINSLWGDEEKQLHIRALLGRFDAEQLRQHIIRLCGELESVHKMLTNVAHRHGELTQQLSTMLEDRESPDAHLRLSMIQQRLDEGVAEWKVISAIAMLLKSVYKRYEKERQPEVLGQASDYLSQMTEGRYSRIWTPLAEDVLRIDDAEGNPLPVELLSRGAREQVFLSLRLALIENYAQRGVKMPIILDDVLVNFDHRRALASTQVICDVARSGHQILMFTCHDHLVEMFRELGADLRPIPKRSRDIVWEGPEERRENPYLDADIDVVEPPVETMEEVDAA